MATSPELMCYVCPAPFRQFLEAVTNMRFDEEPNYSKLISFFESLIEPCSQLRPIRIDGAMKVFVISVSIVNCTNTLNLSAFFNYCLLNRLGKSEGCL